MEEPQKTSSRNSFREHKKPGRPKGSKNKPKIPPGKREPPPTPYPSKIPSYVLDPDYGEDHDAVVRLEKILIGMCKKPKRNHFIHFDIDRIKKESALPGKVTPKRRRKSRPMGRASIFAAKARLLITPECPLVFGLVLNHNHICKRTGKRVPAWETVVGLKERMDPAKFDRMPQYFTKGFKLFRHTRKHHRHLANSYIVFQESGEITQPIPSVEKTRESPKSDPLSNPSEVLSDSAEKDNSASHPDYRGPPCPTSNRSPLRPSSTVKKLWNRKLQRKTAWTVSEMERQQRRSGIKVRFPSRNAYTFAREGLHKGFKDWELIRTWIKAAETTYVDTSDGLTRSEPALLLFHARRILALRDKLTDQERVQSFYSGRASDRESKLNVTRQPDQRSGYCEKLNVTPQCNL